MKKPDHYLKIVEWSEEDQCYVGSIPGWIGECCHGDDEEDVYRQLCQILDEWIEIYEKRRDSFAGRHLRENVFGKISIKNGQ